MSLSPDELERHKRHILLKEIGGPGVRKLLEATVSIVGAGAIGGPAALYLAAAGIGRLEIWDDDRVDRSNLQRQVQFGEGDVGRLKVEALLARLARDHPATTVTIHSKRWDARAPLAGTILIDASDNFSTRFALNRIAHTSRRALVSGAAAGWTGQVGVFASGIVPGMPCYQCWVPEAPPAAGACDEVGVVGAVTGLVGASLALETVKLITGAGDTPGGRLLMIDGLSGAFRTVRLRPDPACPICA